MSVVQNQNGTYTAFWYINRRRHQKTFMSPKIAEDWIAKKRLEKEKDEVYGRDNRTPILDLIKQYRQEVKKSKSSIERDDIISIRWEKWLGNQRIKTVSALTKGHLAEYEEYRRKDNVSQRTINIDLKFINAALNHAWKHDRIKYNPVSRYPYKSAPATFSRYLTAEEIKNLLDVSGQWFQLVYTMLTLGLRAEEACYLEYTDHRDGIIHIRVKKVQGQLWSPKWGRERWVSLTEDYANDTYLQEFFKKKKRGMCFPSRSGILTRDAVYHIIKRIAKKSKIDSPDDICPHLLRHTHVSYMVARVGISKHISLRNIMDNVGIGDYQTLLRYSQAVRNLGKNLPDPDRLPWQILANAQK